jgi:hypothetical protein
VAASTPLLQAAAKPSFRGFSTIATIGVSSRIEATVPSVDALSTTITSSPGASSRRRGGSDCRTASRLLKVTTTAERRVTAARS